MEHVHNVTRYRSRYQTLVIDVISYNLRIIQEYFQPKIGRKIRIFSLGRKNNILIKKKKKREYFKCIVSCCCSLTFRLPMRYSSSESKWVVWRLLMVLYPCYWSDWSITLTLKMTTAQVVETSVTVNNNSPIQNYVHPDDQTQPTVQTTYWLDQAKLTTWERLENWQFD